MAQARYYSSSAVDTELTASVASGDTVIPVAATTGFPVSFPYTLVIDPDTSSQEIVTVTAASGLNLTVTRGEDGTGAVAHNAGAVVSHQHTARDFTESRQHEDSSTGVHGVSGAVVGTTDTQTLTNKTLTAPTITDPTVTESSGWTAYTPTWTASTTNPSIGDGSLVGSYKKTGRTVHFRIRMEAGPSTSFGSGPWVFSLPVSTARASQEAIGVGVVRDESASGVPTGACFPARNTAEDFAVVAQAGGLISSSNPFTWASGDTLSISGTYEAAS